MGTGFAGLRRELTAVRKELAISNNLQRGKSNKIDDTAVLTEHLTEKLLSQGRALAAITSQLGTVLAAAAGPRTPAGASLSANGDLVG